MCTYLVTIRSLPGMARDEWQWIDTFPKTNLLPGEVERDRWLTREEAERLIRCCAPHLAALVRFALATGCRAAEITGLEWVTGGSGSQDGLDQQDQERHAQGSTAE
jgi:integrase